MSANPVPEPVLSAALSACVVESELLNSERIAERFGSYGLELLADSGGIRRSSLYSEHDGRAICRTYAVVRFEDVPDAIIGNEHAQILAGRSIGAIFKASGWSIYKETRYVGELRLPSGEHPLRDRMCLGEQLSVAMHVYRLLLKKESQVVEYATIIEVHHPDYLGREELADLYVVDAPLRLKEKALTEYSELALSRE